MNVYVVVMSFDYEGSCVEGVFSSKDEALEFAETFSIHGNDGPEVFEYTLGVPENQYGRKSLF